MKRLIIVGAGAFGREALQWALDVPAAARDWEPVGFLDNRSDALQGFDLSVGIIGTATDYQIQPDDRFICAIGDSKVRLEVCRQLEARGAEFVTLIHPTAVVAPTAQIAPGGIVCPYAIVSVNSVVGRHVALNVQAVVGHDAQVADGCTLSPHSGINGFVVLGEGAFLGSHGAVLPSVQVGEYGKVAAGSVAFADVAPHTTVVGVPARAMMPARVAAPA
jgi:sugar O-acyltransferase (sialic acid O-acetyltransferase NeuD family)